MGFEKADALDRAKAFGGAADRFANATERRNLLNPRGWVSRPTGSLQ